MGGPVWSGRDRLCQTRLIPRSPDGDNNILVVQFSLINEPLHRRLGKRIG